MLNKNIKENYREAVKLIREASNSENDVAASILVLANTISSQDLVDMKGVAKSLDNLSYAISRMKS